MAVSITTANKFIEDVKRRIQTVNAFVGESFVVNARQSVNRSVYERPVFTAAGNPRQRYEWELSKNLLNSIGYGIRYAGQTSTKNGGGEGGKKTDTLISKVIKDDMLVLAAGMEYAAYVESKGYDVISNSVNKAKEQHKALLKKTLKV